MLPILLEADDLDDLAQTISEAVADANDVDGVAWKQAASSLVRDLGVPRPVSNDELASWLAQPEGTSLRRIGEALHGARSDLRRAFGLPATPAPAGEGDLREALAQEAAGLLSENASSMSAEMRQWFERCAALARHQAPAVDVPAERQRIKLALKIWHQNSCYPTASDGELEIGADAILATRPTDPGGAQ